MFLNTPSKVRLPNLADLTRIVLLSDSQLYTANSLPDQFRPLYGLPHIIIFNGLIVGEMRHRVGCARNSAVCVTCVSRVWVGLNCLRIEIHYGNWRRDFARWRLACTLLV